MNRAKLQILYEETGIGRYNFRVVFRNFANRKKKRAVAALLSHPNRDAPTENNETIKTITEKIKIIPGKIRIISVIISKRENGRKFNRKQRNEQQ